MKHKIKILAVCLTMIVGFVFYRYKIANSLSEPELVVKKYVNCYHKNDGEGYLNYVNFIGFTEEGLQQLKDSAFTDEYPS